MCECGCIKHSVLCRYVKIIFDISENYPVKKAQSWSLSVLLLYLLGIYTLMDDTYTHFDFYDRLVLIQMK